MNHNFEIRKISGLKYENIRDRIKTGDIFFTASDSIVSRVIRFFTRSKVSHIGLFIWLGKRLFVVEAGFAGVSMALASERFYCQETVYWGKIDHEESEEQIIDKSLETLRHKYDFWGAILSFLWRKEDGRFYCSELVVHALNIDSEFSERGTTPDDLARLAKEIFRLQFNC